MHPARVAAYQAAVINPRDFLRLHFQLTTTSCPSCIEDVFKKFAALTDKSEEKAKRAAELFVNEGKVEDFVLQAASAKVQDKYADAAGP